VFAEKQVSNYLRREFCRFSSLKVIDLEVRSGRSARREGRFLCTPTRVVSIVVLRSGVTADAHSEQSSSVFAVRYSVEAERSLVTIEGTNGVDLLHSVSMNRRIREVEASLDSLEDKLRRKEDKGTSVIGPVPRT
jgi:hypothetical protein